MSTTSSLAAPARRTARLAAEAGAVAGHDGAAEVAARGVAHVDHLAQGVGRVSGLALGKQCGLRRGVDLWDGGGLCAVRLLLRGRLRVRTRAQVLKQRLLLAGEEAQIEPAEDVIHDRVGVADLRVLRPAAGLKARVRKFVDQQAQAQLSTRPLTVEASLAMVMKISPGLPSL